MDHKNELEFRIRTTRMPKSRLNIVEVFLQNRS